MNTTPPSPTRQDLRKKILRVWDSHYLRAGLIFLVGLLFILNPSVIPILDKALDVGEKIVEREITQETVITDWEVLDEESQEAVRLHIIPPSQTPKEALNQLFGGITGRVQESADNILSLTEENVISFIDALDASLKQTIKEHLNE